MPYWSDFQKESTLEIIDNDLKEISSRALTIRKTIRQLQEMRKEDRYDLSKWSTLFDEILDCTRKIDWIIKEKRGRM